MHIQIDSFLVEVQRKPIRRLNLRVSSQDGQIHLSLPPDVSLEEGENFVRRHTGWLLRTCRRMQTERLQSACRYVTGERYMLLGRPYVLQVEHISLGNSVFLTGDTILLKCSPHSTEAGRKAVYDNFLRRQLAAVLDNLVPLWLQRTGEAPVTWSIRCMKTEWGSCTPGRRTMRFNLELAKHPAACIEYVVVHEITHLRIANHSAAFWQLMSERLPDWRALRRQLNEKQTIKEDIV